MRLTHVDIAGRTLGIATALALVTVTAAATVPSSVSYQGVLEEAGVPMDGPVEATFAIYAVEEGGAPLWSETWGALPIADGRFNVMLGASVPFTPSAFTGGARWLEITVDGATLAPRRPFTSVPYAMHAAVADSITGGCGADDGDWVVDGANVYRLGGRVGIGTATPGERLDVAGRVAADGLEIPATLGSPILSLTRVDPPGETAFVVYIGGSGYGGYPLQLGRSDGSNGVHVPGRLGIGTRSPQAPLDVAGTGRMEVLEITGGSDLAEPFDISSDVPIVPGMLVGLDPERPGALRATERPYDPTVVGVVSGARGIAPGLVMGQEGTIADGEHPVALAGRVYCLAEADTSPIRPGDLLTTSAVPGHAMKAVDHALGSGAIVGKAMSMLERGRGHVYMIVSLQ